jgi:hypothetical protein
MVVAKVRNRNFIASIVVDNNWEIAVGARFSGLPIMLFLRNMPNILLVT